MVCERIYACITYMSLFVLKYLSFPRTHIYRYTHTLTPTLSYKKRQHPPYPNSKQSHLLSLSVGLSLHVSVCPFCHSFTRSFSSSVLKYAKYFGVVVVWECALHTYIMVLRMYNVQVCVRFFPLWQTMHLACSLDLWILNCTYFASGT